MDQNGERLAYGKPDRFGGTSKPVLNSVDTDGMRN